MDSNTDRHIVFGKVVSKKMYGKTVYIIRLRKYFSSHEFEPYDDIILIEYFETKNEARDMIIRKGFHYAGTWGDASAVASKLNISRHRIYGQPR
jgi:hypothetical protein